MSMHNVAYYHVYLTENVNVWASIVVEQLKYLEDTRLLYNLDTIRVTCISKFDSRIELFSSLCGSYSANFDIVFYPSPYNSDGQMTMHKNNFVLSENLTQRRIYEDAKIEDMNILYFHTKGATIVPKTPISIQKFKKYYYWRDYMQYGCFEKWQECVNALQTHDVVGSNYQTSPVPYIAGGFWWSKSDYIRRLPDPNDITWWRKLQEEYVVFKAQPDRVRDEMWIGAGENLKVFELDSLPMHRDPSNDCLPKFEFMEYMN